MASEVAAHPFAVERAGDGGPVAHVEHEWARAAACGDDLDEERIIKSATGIRNTVVWKKLYRFQRDGVVGAIDKLERFGGCIIADSVGLLIAQLTYLFMRKD